MTRSRDWTFISSHAMVLAHLAQHEDSRLCDMEEALGLTERRIRDIIHDLVASGMLTVEKVGRRNVYCVNPEAKLKHPLLSHVKVGNLIRLLIDRRQTVTARVSELAIMLPAWLPFVGMLSSNSSA